MKIIFICIFIPAALGYPEGRTTMTKKDVCKMKPPVGIARGIFPGWFYNESLDLCQYYEFSTFKLEHEKINKFSNLSECSKTCRSHVPSFCFDTPKKTGKKALIYKWTYNSTRGKCVKWYWEPETTRDSNVFEMEGDCLDICQGPDYGPCAQLPTELERRHDNTQYYRYNLTSQTCYLDRTYIGIRGENAFLTLNACYARCGRFVKNKCKLPVQDLGMCSRIGPRYMFDREEKKCKKYTGCDHHGIGFYNQSECYNTCESPVDRRCLPDLSLRYCKPKDDVFYRYDQKKGKCFLDNNYHCRGSNGFVSEEDCNKICAQRK
ncbi:papilin-like [Ixodes scapularis]|uniref:papilin-like n=1 Tax=Ixodes scapularis TaxID=6945 RepID=UPI001A9DAECA|nr:papilin-like [Ixodes scapularis]